MIGMSAVPYANRHHAGLAHLPRLRVKTEGAVHPILVGPTESHEQRKGWIARRSAVDL